MSLLLQEEDTPENGELSMELFRIEQYVEMVLQYLRLDSPRTMIWLSGQWMWTTASARPYGNTRGLLSGKRSLWTFRRPA